MKAAITSRFDENQQVWLLRDGKVWSGTVTGIRGEKSFLYGNHTVIMAVKITAGDVSCTEWVSEELLFATKQELLDSVIKSAETA